jgi:hypothetical protein
MRIVALGVGLRPTTGDGATASSDGGWGDAGS